MKILITGATGQIGHKLALTLAEQNNEIHILVRNPNSFNIPKHKNIRVFQGDITDVPSISAAIKGCKQVYHVAAMVKIFNSDATQFYKINVEGTQNLLQKSLETGVEKFLFTSSCSVIGPSDGKALTENDSRTTAFSCDYDTTKSQAEKLVKEYASKGLHTVIVSPSKIYGHSCRETKDISINKVIENFINGKITFIPKPSHLISNYCFIDDVVEGHILALNKGKSGENYILGGENISYKDFFHTIKNIAETKTKLIEIPEIFAKILSVFQWIQFYTIGKEPFITNKSIKQIFCNKIFSSDKAITHLGYKITPITEGLQHTIYSLKNQNHEN
ncbi:NAD-dependent epimerase/dehydratase family protein [Flavobacterium undicola]|uniref:NAD-dependent epimerase/dehydratase family protein n=1 Tax=Flavobacterium undicola TaxID=1932779 RepID=UPI0013776B4C|nr:NAD-dependent epimerase/dehydratase family protein [Flavobacterium undicola]MBA0883332.1 NAD-dependent epimerase/dehydratase family protein [Flavobacterium undicola]